MSGLRLTPEQQRALALDRHVAVIANAGSGKTSVLTQRYLAILRAGVPVRDIVAITFTEKAAAEMKKRVRQALLSPDDIGVSRAQAAEWIREIGTARITTFHSFCNGIIRVYGGDADIDPDVRQVTPQERAWLRRQALSTVSREWLSATGDRRDRALRFFDRMGLFNGTSVIDTLLNSRENLTELQRWMAYAGDADAHRAEIRVAAADRLRRHVAGLIGPMMDDLAQCAGEEAVNEPFRILTQLRESLLGRSDETTFDTAAQIIEYVTSFTTQKGQWLVRHPVGKHGRAIRGDQEIPGAKAARDLPLPLWSDDVERLHLDLVRTAIEIASDGSREYQRLKAERTVIDFDDMMVSAFELLNHAPIRDDVARSIQHLLVDEFQDTNPLQWQIVRLIAPTLDENTAGTPGPTLFIVGDPKQSIYRFRDADVHLFHNAMSMIAAANMRSGRQDTGRVPLSISFRMTPLIAAVVNDACAHAFGAAAEQEAIPFEPTVCGAPSADVATSASVLFTMTKAPDIGGEDELDPSSEDEWHHVSDKIIQFLRDGVAPESITVLVRTHRHGTECATVLRGHGLLVQLHGGRAFYSRPEVADIRNLLRFCADPADDMALAAIVRSPYFLLDDRVMDRVVRATPHGSLWERLQAYAEQDEAVQHVTNILRTAHTSAFEDPLTDVVRRVMTATQWHAAIAVSPRREQIIANAEKLLDIIREVSASTMGTLRDVVEAIEAPEEADAESDATFRAQQGCVNVMTWHNAKGLEWPVVILAGMGGKPGGFAALRRSRPPFALTFSVAQQRPDPDDPFGMMSDPESLVHLMQKSEIEQEEIAELRRLFYVGMTRARQHLVISLTYQIKTDGTPAKPNTMQQMLLDWMRLRDMEPLGDENAVEYMTDLEVYDPSIDEESERRRTIQQPVILHVSRDFDRSITWTPTHTTVSPEDLSESLMHDARLEAVTATELAPDDDRLLSESENPFELPFELPVELPSELPVELPSELPFSGPVFGSAVHALLEHTVPLLATTAVHDAIAAASDAIDDTVETELLDAAREEVRRVLESPLITEYAPVLATSLLERSLFGLISDTVLQGKMDLRFEHDGIAEVWDWKTTKLDAVEDVRDAARVYQLQMMAYAWLSLMASPTARIARTRLLYTRRAGAESSHWVATTEWTREQLPTLEAELLAAIRAVVARRTARSQVLQSSTARNSA